MESKRKGGGIIMWLGFFQQALGLLPLLQQLLQQLPPGLTNTTDFTVKKVGVGAVVVALLAVGCYYLAPRVSCHFNECPEPHWISFSSEGLKNDLDNRLFGQHIASRIVIKAVNGFMSNDNPSKPLVLSLHGPTGTGKNFISKLIADNIYKKGIDSSYVHLYSATHHFPHPQGHLRTYKAQLKQWLRKGVSECERSMFIFDEVDKMHPELIDSIKPYLDHYAKLDGISYRKSIFIFLSNAGGEVITERALDFWRAGQKREEIEYKHLEASLTESLFNNKDSGFYRSSLIDKTMADFFVPFLPLEYGHVVQCVLAEMKNKGLPPNQEVAETMAKDLTYTPKTEKLFSSNGCKTVGAKLHFYL